jgi:PAT family beta-lactamase induction signal transducer AmpG
MHEGFAYRMRWVAILYFAQGFPFGVFRDVWPVYFRANGVSLKEIGLMSLLALPYTWKPLWAPLVDRFGDRRVWIAGCLVVMGVLLAVHPLFDASHLHPVFWGVMLAFMFGSATQDIAIDAHTIGFLERGEEGAANGLRVSAYRVALIASGGGIVLLAAVFGWGPMWIGAGVVLAALAPVVLKAPRASLRSEERRRFLAPFAEWIRKPGSVAALAFVLLYKLGDQAIGPMIKPFWVDRGLTLTEIGLVSTTLGVVFSVIGALLGGFLTTRWGLTRSLLVLGVAQVAPNLGYAACAALHAGHEAIYAASILESFGQGLGTAALLSLMMRLCDKEHAGTQYALLSAFFALSRDLSGAASGFAAQAFGYGAFFLYTFFLGLPALALLPWVNRRVEAAAR